ncbi:Spermidine hydroxycinnamoyl transferase [Thalictrum thalictroides]|uniref:Spermidine hydroxycinnamoyl transferase n=1 Tax=Thalictrum thalictroides TaxID=46969 RepID=A0A7J6WTN8_THATH|nr:Spermidine hydroxycinnamoyl transferase [Thalictrum thalictroides]
MVSIERSCIVKPNEQTPDVKLRLSECDQIKPYTHAPTFYIYPPQNIDSNKSISSPFHTLKISLSHVLVPYYPLAGRLNLIGGGRFVLNCNGLGAEIFEAESQSEIKDLGDFRPTSETRKLIPTVDYTEDISELPLLLVQLTRFKCGGISIGVAISHIVADGKGALEFISSWANFARGENKLVVEPYHDRNVFYKGDPLSKPRFDHHELKAFPTLIGHDDAEEERKKECTNTMLKLSKTQVNKLKEMANEGKDATSRHYSRYEAIAAHIWRCASKSRKLQNAQLTSLRVPVDCRNRLKPTLPQGYYGNAVMVTSPIAEVGKLMLGLGDACDIIRQSAEMFNDDYIKSSIDFLANQEDLTKRRAGFHTDSQKGLFLGNPNVTITSWLGLTIYDADFGWGKPIFMGPAGLGFDGKSFVIPVSDEDGSFVIPIRLQVTHMDDFKKLFYQDICCAHRKQIVATVNNDDCNLYE